MDVYELLAVRKAQLREERTKLKNISAERDQLRKDAVELAKDVIELSKQNYEYKNHDEYHHSLATARRVLKEKRYD